MKRTLQMATLSLVALAAASSYAQEPPAASPPPAEPAPAGSPAGMPGVAAGSVGGMLIGADLQLALPLGSFSDVSNIGIGVLGRFEYTVLPQLNLTGRLGFTYFVGKNDLKFWTIPILVGGKFTVAPNFYIAGEIGLFNNHSSVDIPGFGSVSASETDFGLTAGAGYRLNGLDLRLLFEFLDLGHAGDTTAVVASVGWDFWKK